jgi:hypothetical protein
LHNKPIDVRYYVLLLGTILSENITYFCSIVAFLNEVVIIDIKFNLRNKLGLKRMFRWLLLAVMSLFLLAGCGDLEPEMQDTRTVILNMDFHGKSSLRSSSSVSASELSQYNTHLILALPSGEVLTSNYNNFSSSLAQGLMNTADKKVSLEIPLNTQMKIFAFLFQENYSMSELIPGVREVGYYGESQTFSIGTQTNNLSLGITLNAASANEDDNIGEGDGDDHGTDTTELEGTWETACYTNSDNTSAIGTITMVGNVITLKDEKHSDTSCATDYSLTRSSHTFSIGNTATFSDGKTGHEFTVTIGSTEEITPQSASTVSSYNSSIKCGASDWELNTEKECSIDNASETIYCLYQLDGNNLYPNCNDSSYPSTSNIDTRDASSTFVKQ